jgi:hypothetical protein
VEYPLLFNVLAFGGPREYTLVTHGRTERWVKLDLFAGGKMVRRCPLFVNPEVTRYKGAGSIDDFASFTCVKP